MDVCIEYINRQTYKYQYTYSLLHTYLNSENEYIYFELHVCMSKDANTKSGYAEIGIIDTENLSLYPCKVKLGYVYIKSAEAIPDSLTRSRSEDTVYNFSCYLFDKSFSTKKDFQYIGTVHELAGCCQVLNYYVNNGFDITTCNFNRLRNKYRHSVDRWGIEAYTMLDISANLQFTNFIEFIYAAENRAYSSTKYSPRRGEYAHIYWETLAFRTENPAFAEIVGNILQRHITEEDNLYCIEYEFKEDTDYNGGLSVAVEKEGTEEIQPKGHFKKETITKLINQCCRSFPSELYMICKLISE